MGLCVLFVLSIFCYIDDNEMPQISAGWHGVMIFKPSNLIKFFKFFSIFSFKIFFANLKLISLLVVLLDKTNYKTKIIMKYKLETNFILISLYCPEE